MDVFFLSIVSYIKVAKRKASITILISDKEIYSETIFMFHCLSSLKSLKSRDSVQISHKL